MWISSDFLWLKKKARVSTGSRAPRSAGCVDRHFILSAPHPLTLCPRKSMIPRTKVSQSYPPALPQQIHFQQTARRNPAPGAPDPERPTRPVKVVGRNLVTPPRDQGGALRKAGWE